MKRSQNPYNDSQVLESDAWSLGYNSSPNLQVIVENPFKDPLLRGVWAKGRLALLVDIRPIPKGLYCHGPLINNGVNEFGLPKFKSPQMCPYWSSDPTKNEQQSGYCSFLDVGDWENKGAFLLWDQVKECGVNEESEDES